jgi:hypothetical protein
VSYSFSVKAKSKQSAMAEVSRELTKVVGDQPIHAHDRAAATRAAYGMLSILADDPAKDVSMSMSGYVGWNSSTDKPDEIITANVNVTAGLVSRE